MLRVSMKSSRGRTYCSDISWFSLLWEAGEIPSRRSDNANQQVNRILEQCVCSLEAGQNKWVRSMDQSCPSSTGLAGNLPRHTELGVGDAFGHPF